MQRTGMTRSTFYHYFSGVDELAIGLLEELEHDIRASVDTWLRGDGGDDPRAATVRHLTEMFEVMEKHRVPVRALGEAAGGHPLFYRRWQTRVVDHFVELTTGFIRRQIARGRSRADDPERLARSLILMNDAVAHDVMLRDADGDLADTAAVVAGVWNAAIFGA